MTNIVSLIILIFFSFILSFGIFDPIFGTGSAFGLVDLFAILLVATSFSLNFKVIVKRLDRNVIYLFLLLFFLFFSSVIYGDSTQNKNIFNFKLLVMILLYMALFFKFKINPISIHYSLLAFSVGVVFFVILVNTLYSSEVIISKGRLFVFDENPNSTSARFTLAAIYLIYISIYDPFKSVTLRYMSFLSSLPVMYVVLQSGSRGSVLSLAISLIILLYLSDFKKKYKVFFSLLLGVISPYVFHVFMNAGSIAERFNDAISEGGFGARDEIWTSALAIFLNNPIFGVGEPGYLQEMMKSTGRAVDAHNLPLYILASGGLISFALFLFFYKKIVVRSYYLLLNRDVLPLILLINITLIALKTGGVLTYSIMWFIFAIVSAYPLRGTNSSRS